jgi:hypothetical protein
VSINYAFMQKLSYKISSTYEIKPEKQGAVPTGTAPCSLTDWLMKRRRLKAGRVA